MCDVLQGVGGRVVVRLGFRLLQIGTVFSQQHVQFRSLPMVFKGAGSGETAGRANSPLCAEDP